MPGSDGSTGPAWIYPQAPAGMRGQSGFLFVLPDPADQTRLYGCARTSFSECREGIPHGEGKDRHRWAEWTNPGLISWTQAPEHSQAPELHWCYPVISCIFVVKGLCEELGSRLKSSWLVMDSQRLMFKLHFSKGHMQRFHSIKFSVIYWIGHTQTSRCCCNTDFCSLPDKEWKCAFKTFMNAFRNEEITTLNLCRRPACPGSQVCHGTSTMSEFNSTGRFAELCQHVLHHLHLLHFNQAWMICLKLRYSLCISQL